MHGVYYLLMVPGACKHRDLLGQIGTRRKTLSLLHPGYTPTVKITLFTHVYVY